jgi:hypothetical protein
MATSLHYSDKKYNGNISWSYLAFLVVGDFLLFHYRIPQFHLDPKTGFESLGASQFWYLLCQNLPNQI